MARTLAAPRERLLRAEASVLREAICSQQMHQWDCKTGVSSCHATSGKTVRGRFPREEPLPWPPPDPPAVGEALIVGSAERFPDFVIGTDVEPSCLLGATKSRGTDNWEVPWEPTISTTNMAVLEDTTLPLWPICSPPTTTTSEPMAIGELISQKENNKDLKNRTKLEGSIASVEIITVQQKSAKRHLK